MSRRSHKNRWEADFETTTDPNDCRVWAFAMCEIGNDTHIMYANTIESALDLMLSRGGDIFYFHNLKFDGEFILHYLFSNGWSYCKDKKDLRDRQFSTLISGTGAFYSITIRDSGEITEIYDSLKILPFSVDVIAKSFGLEISKLSIDYDEYREPGHQLTEDEKEYVTNDVRIVAQAMQVLLSQGHNRMTQGSNAMADFKSMYGTKDFERSFPQLECDGEVRKAYRGGITQVNNRYKLQDIGSGVVLDVNSLYPYVMHDKPLPYGNPVKFDGRYKSHPLFTLYVQRVSCKFKLKPNKMPIIQIKGNFRFENTEYLEESGGESVILNITNIDEELIFDNYDVWDIEWLGGYMFLSSTEIFKRYIDKWYAVKAKATIDGNGGMRTLAKLMQNALYGKFGLNPHVENKHPYLDNGVVKYRTEQGQDRKPVYIPMAVFITSWARWVTITAAQQNYDRFLYCDTDSLHLIGTDPPQGIKVHPTDLGAWKHESTFTRARYIRAKTYIEEINGQLSITCAGMPKTCYEQVTWDNFKPGAKYGGKLLPRHVNGGIVLQEEYFTIKDD